MSTESAGSRAQSASSDSTGGGGRRPSAVFVSDDAVMVWSLVADLVTQLLNSPPSSAGHATAQKELVSRLWGMLRRMLRTAFAGWNACSAELFLLMRSLAATHGMLPELVQLSLQLLAEIQSP